MILERVEEVVPAVLQREKDSLRLCGSCSCSSPASGEINSVWTMLFPAVETNTRITRPNHTERAGAGVGGFGPPDHRFLTSSCC